jgi:uncharacterized protein
MPRRALDVVIRAGEQLVTDAEVFQEILHRYAALGRRDAIGPATDTLLQIVDHVFPITRDDVLHARNLVVAAEHSFSARDAVHIAVMRAHGITRVLTFDSDFDRLTDIARVKL